MIFILFYLSAEAPLSLDLGLSTDKGILLFEDFTEKEVVSKLFNDLSFCWWKKEKESLLQPRSHLYVLKGKSIFHILIRNICFQGITLHLY